MTPPCLVEYHNCDGLRHVPTLWRNVTLRELGIQSIEDIVRFADGRSMINHVREGLVFKSADGFKSFKVISNNFLLKENT